MFNFIKQTITIFSILFLVACGGGGGSTPVSETPPTLSTDATLSALTISAGTTSPTFTSDTTSYTLILSSTAVTTVTPTVNQANATVTVNGTSVASSTASASIPLAAGNTVISIVVTAQDGSTTQTYSVTVTRFVSLELLDPTPGASNKFGESVVILANGNIVVSDPGDSSVASNSGAVHLYSPFSSTPIASIFGDVAGDQLGKNGITALSNNNYVISSELDDEGGIVDAGSVRLMNGSTGVQIGATIAGNASNDALGRNGSIALGNNNFVFASVRDDEGGIVDAGSVRLMNGSTGVQIGAALVGDVDSDFLGSGGITVLGNNNYVVTSPSDDETGIINAGTVRLVNGSTGAQIGVAMQGETAGDNLGRNGITVLGNNNYVIASELYDELGVVNSGSVQLVNGSTGVQIGATIAGDNDNDSFGSNGILALGNNNFVFASELDDVGGVSDAGSVRLVNGSTGVQIGDTLGGDVVNDFLGSSGVTILGNNNYVVASGSDSEGGVTNVGSVRLMNGSTGVQIGNTLVGDLASDALGSGGTTSLGNNNFIIASPTDNEGGIVDAGSVRLVNGSTGAPIGTPLVGDTENDFLGSSITALGNNNYVVKSEFVDVGVIVDAGSVQLVNGSTGAPIGTALVGDFTSDLLGRNDTVEPKSITALSNNNYVIVSSFDDVGGIANAGSARLVNGVTGAEIVAAITGEATNDMSGVRVITALSGDYIILSQPFADNGGQIDAGKVQIIAP